eukprot:SAG31_NODE_1017_length_10360_cov_35.198811_7_plen_93_part_00
MCHMNVSVREDTNLSLISGRSVIALSRQFIFSQMFTRSSPARRVIDAQSNPNQGMAQSPMTAAQHKNLNLVFDCATFSMLQSLPHFIAQPYS